MAQGKLKTKTKLPGGAKLKGSHHKKSLGPKKGGRVIPPKKNTHVQASKLQKDLTRTINCRNESRIKAKAGTNELKGFSIIKTPKDLKEEEKKKKEEAS